MYLPNATLTATINDPTPTGFNPVTGAPIFTQSTVFVSCSLEEDRNPIAERSPGIEETAIFLTGRAIKPALLPAAFIPNQRYSCTIELAEGTVTGKFYLLPSIKGRLGLEPVFGEAIAGWFVR